MGALLPAGFFIKLLTSLIVSVVMTAFKAVVGLVFGGKQKPNSGANSRDQRIKQDITETTAKIPVIYGTSRTGALRIFYATALAYQGTEDVQGSSVDTRGDYLYITACFCHGKVS